MLIEESAHQWQTQLLTIWEYVSPRIYPRSSSFGEDRKEWALILFSKIKNSITTGENVTTSWLKPLWQRETFQVINNFFPFIALFIYWKTWLKYWSRMIAVHMWSCEMRQTKLKNTGSNCTVKMVFRSSNCFCKSLTGPNWKWLVMPFNKDATLGSISYMLM